MTTTSQTSDSLYSKESFSNDFIELDDWLVAIKVYFIFFSSIVVLVHFVLIHDLAC